MRTLKLLARTFRNIIRLLGTGCHSSRSTSMCASSTTCAHCSQIRTLWSRNSIHPSAGTYMALSHFWPRDTDRVVSHIHAPCKRHTTDSLHTKYTMTSAAVHIVVVVVVVVVLFDLLNSMQIHTSGQVPIAPEVCAAGWTNCWLCRIGC